jgi:hypothetical protein
MIYRAPRCMIELGRCLCHREEGKRAYGTPMAHPILGEVPKVECGHPMVILRIEISDPVLLMRRSRNLPDFDTREVRLPREGHECVW